MTFSRIACRGRGFEVITAASIDESVKIAEANDVVIILISVAADTDSDETSQILQRAAQALAGTPIVILSDGEQPHQVRNALRAARAAMSRQACPSMRRLEPSGSCMRGGVPTRHLHHSNGTRKFGRRALVRPFGIFTVRQAAVVKAIRQGKPNKIIAYELKMKENTVKVHVRNIMRKLKAKNRTQVCLHDKPTRRWIRDLK